MSYRVSDRVRQHSRQRRTPRLLLLELADFADDSGVAWPSVPTLAARIGESERNTFRLLRTLLESGELLSAPGGGRGRPTVYGVAVGLPAPEVERLRERLERQRGEPKNPDIPGANPDTLDTVTDQETLTFSDQNPDIPGIKTLTFSDRGEGPNTAAERGETARAPGGIHHGSIMDPDLSLATQERGRPPTAAPPPAPPAPVDRPPPEERPQRNRDPHQDHPACLAYREIVKLRPDSVSAGRIALGYARNGERRPAVEDLDRWRAMVEEWRSSGHNIRNLSGILDWYHDPARQPGEGNHATNRRGGRAAGYQPYVPGSRLSDESRATLEYLLSLPEDGEDVLPARLAPAAAD